MIESFVDESRGIRPALAGELWGKWAFALLARAFGVRFQSSLRTDEQVFGDDYFRVEE